MENNERITQMGLKHDLNQQQDLDLGHKLNMADSKTRLCKGYGADGSRTGNKYGNGLRDKGKTLDLRVKCESGGVPKALIIT